MNDFTTFWNLGYRDLLPVAPPGVKGMWGVEPKSVGKVPGELNGDGSWHTLDAWQHYRATEADLARWSKMGASVSLRCGYGNGLLAIDADTLNEKLSALIRTEIESALGSLPERVGRAPKFIRLCRTDPKYHHPDIFFEGGTIEVRTYGQIVVVGPHPETRKPYQWTIPPVSTNELPYASPEVLDRLWARLKEILPCSTMATARVPRGPPPPQETLTGPPAMIERAMEAIPNDYRDRRVYINMAVALKAACRDDPDLGLRLFQKWCSDWTLGENLEETILKDWNSLKPPFEFGADWIYVTASYRSPQKFPRGLQFFEELPETPANGESLSLDDSPAPLLGTVFDFPDAVDIEPEEFMYDSWLVRDYVTLIAAQTKVGKSLFAITVALSLCSGRPLLGVTPDARYRVRIWNGEDTRKTMVRRVLACMKHFGLSREDVDDRLIFDSGRDQPIVMALQTRSGTVIQRPIIDSLVLGLQNQKVDVLIVDPFIKIHQVSENDNAAIDVVAREWVDVTTRAHVGLVLVHHSRKLNGSDASIDDARGASSLPSAARSALVMARMTKREAKTLGRSKDYKGLFRIADAASNLAAAPGDDEKWFEIKSVDLCNGRFDAEGRLLRRSDRIGVATLSATVGGIEEEDTPATPEGQSSEAKALAALASGDFKRSQRSGDEWAGAPICIAFGLDIEDPDDKARASAILARLIREGKLAEVQRTDKNRKTKTFLEVKQADNSLLWSSFLD